VRHTRHAGIETGAAFGFITTQSYAFSPAFTRGIGAGTGGAGTTAAGRGAGTVGTSPAETTRGNLTASNVESSRNDGNDDSPLFAGSVVVLKFGGGLLRTIDDTHLVTHEIYRWIRRGWRVVAVVSALGETTDTLSALAARAGAGVPHAEALASVLATGEQTSAGLLALALDRAGVPVEVLDAARISLRTHGEVTDSSPESVDVGVIHRSLARVPVVVVPGFVGRDSHDRTTLLGRGGSDLTAVFLAAALGARCRLVKDVPGLFDRPPASTRPRDRALSEHGDGIGRVDVPVVSTNYGGQSTEHEDAPRLFQALTYDDALTLGERVVQHKAVRFARACGQVYEVGGLFTVDATTVGARRTVKSEASVNAGGPLAITILGAGVVAGGVYQALRRLGAAVGSVEPTAKDSRGGPLASARITRVATRTLDRARELGVPDSILTTDPVAAASEGTVTGARVVIELLGGVTIALHAVRAAIRSGAHVITANKALIAAHGDELHDLARIHGVALRYGASVGGALPVLESARRLAADGAVARVEGVLNGTSNYVLDRVARGTSFDDAVRQAIDAGFAEADPSRDLHGLDALDKARLLALAAFPHARGFSIDEIQRIDADAIALHAAEPAQPGVLRHVVELLLISDSVRCTIRLRRVDDTHPAARVRDEGNAVRFTLGTGRVVDITGKGAGRWPTTEAVIADVLDTFQSSSKTPRASNAAEALAP
jgi:homoserine dehydrogenase